MGMHRVRGVLKGLARKTRPAVNITISGELDKAPRQQFRKQLEKLARSFGLSVKSTKVK